MLNNDSEKIMVVLRARGGSKGIKNKNLKLHAGKPMVFYSIKTAIEAGLKDSTILSTDTNKIAHRLFTFKK